MTNSMKRKFFAHSFVFFTLTNIFSYANAAKTPAISATMHEKYKDVKAITAEFVQTQKKIALGKTKTSEGRIYIRRPEMFRWETTKPEPSILVSNGKKVWFYTPPFREGENGQVMVRKAADVQSKLAIDLLSGQANLEKSFKTKKLPDGHFDLVPLLPAGDVSRIELFLEKQTNLVYKVVLHTKTGNETELVLKGVTVNPQLSDSMFQFVPPENTEEIR